MQPEPVRVLRVDAGRDSLPRTIRQTPRHDAAASGRQRAQSGRFSTTPRPLWLSCERAELCSEAEDGDSSPLAIRMPPHSTRRSPSATVGHRGGQPNCTSRGHSALVSVDPCTIGSRRQTAMIKPATFQNPPLVKLPVVLRWCLLVRRRFVTFSYGR